MDKYCDKCHYKAYRKDDTYKSWGFCMKNGIRNLINSPNKKGMVYNIKRGNIPSCMVVQTYYDGKCPFKE